MFSFFCSLSFTLPSLFALGLLLSGSLLNVIPKSFRKCVIPSSRLYGPFACPFIAGCPSNTSSLWLK